VKNEFELFFCLSPEKAVTQEESVYQNFSTQVLTSILLNNKANYICTIEMKHPVTMQ